MKNEIIKLKTPCDNNHVKSIMVIHDYSNIITPDWNRRFVPSGLKDLRDSMTRNGVLTSPTLVKSGTKYLAIDGNHRIKVARENHFSITANIVDIKSTGMTENELMIWLNITPKKWKPEDYLNNGVVYHKSPDYIKLNDVWEETEFAIPALYEIYSCDLACSVRKSMFESGEWRITTLDLGNKTIRHATDLNEYMDFSYKTNFLRALSKCVARKGYNTAHMIKQAKRYKGRIYDSGDRQIGHIQMLHDIYNHRALPEEQLVLNVKTK